MTTNAVLERVSAASSVVAPLGYIRPGAERPYDYAYEPPAGVPWQNYEIDARPMRIVDAREVDATPSIHGAGFTLQHAPTAVRDFYDEEAVKRIYYDEAAALALAVTGAQDAYVFDHLVRKREAGAPLSFGRHV